MFRKIFAAMTFLLALSLFNGYAAYSGETISEITPLMWRATSPSGQSMYLFGSMIVADESIRPLPDYVMDAYYRSDYLAVEINFMVGIDGGPILHLQTYTDGRTIQDEVGPELHASLSAALAELYLEPIYFDTYRPMQWYGLMQNIAMERAGLSLMLGTDFYFILNALTERRIPVLEADNYIAQAEVIYGLSLPLQIALLEQALDLDNYTEELQALYGLWKRGDAEGLEAFVQSQIDALGEHGEEYRHYLLTLRSENIAHAAAQFMADGRNVFFAAGISHMVGDGGVVDLLIRAGYTVELVTDEDFNSPERIQARNLQKLAKVWGFAKYTHPAFLTGERDWDEELLNLIPIVRLADEGEVNDILYEWFTGLGDDGFDEVQGGFFRQGTLRMMPDLDWISDSRYLGEPLASALSRFNRITITDRTNAPVSFDGIGNSVFPNKRSYHTMDFSDDGYRLLGLFRLWNAMNYYFPYLDIIDRDWNRLLLEYIPIMLSGNDRLSYQSALASLTRHLHDAHIWISDGSGNIVFNILNAEFGRFAVPVLLTEAEGRLVVGRAAPRAAPRADVELLPGDVILRLNGRDIEEVAADMLRFMSYPNDDKALKYLAMLTNPLRSHTSNIEVDILRGEDELSLSVRGVIDYFVSPLRPRRSHELLDNNIGLINPMRLSRGEIHDIMRDFADTDGLIIDLRQYPSDFITYSLAEYLIPERRLFVITTSAAQSIPGMYIERFRGYSGGITNPAAFFYENNVVVLMNEETISQAEFTVMSFRNGPNVTVMGSNSIGADGNVTFLPLPGGLTFMYTGLGVYTPEGGQTQRIGLSPDIYVFRTIEGIREGRDELMEAAIEFLLGD